MSDFSRTYDFTAKDALPTGDANKAIVGAEVDAELDNVVTAVATKANKINAGTDGAFVTQDANGHMVDGGTVISAFVKTLLNDPTATEFLDTLGFTALAQTLLAEATASAHLDELGFSSFVQTLLDDADASAFLTTLGVSTFAKEILDDDSAATARLTLETETGATGSLKLPVGTTAQRDGVPAQGYTRANSTTTAVEWYDGSDWVEIGAGGGATGGGDDEVFYENGQNVTTNYTITSSKNAMSAGDIEIDSGVTVTVPSGSKWTIV